MNRQRKSTVNPRRINKRYGRSAGWRAALSGALLLYAAGAAANHPVLVEGEQDFDGDGLLVIAEDSDNS
ncbi:MAG: hypothetical protein FD130_2494, partial [Halothiobacillaceae bacterium]